PTRDYSLLHARGGRGPDATAHHDPATGARHCTNYSATADEPRHRDLVRYTAEGRELNRFYKLPRTTEDLLRRREMIAETTRAGRALIVLIREIGSDFLAAGHIVTRAMQERLKAPYHDRLRAYHRWVAENDLAMGVAQTDAKGDRSRGPS